MRIARRLAAAGLAVAALLAGAAAPAAEDTAEAAVDPDSPFDRQQLLAQARAWQGVWVTSGNPHFKSVAWKIEGGRVRTYDGEEESTMDFTVMAPCLAKLEGDRVSRYRTFVFAEGRRLTSGGSGAGIVTDDGFVACAAREVYVPTDSGCKVWTPQGFDRGFESTECKETETTVEYKTPDLDNWHTLEKIDGVLASRLLQRRSKLEAYESFEAAKAAVDRQNAE